jgi:hypothetical protein
MGMSEKAVTTHFTSSILAGFFATLASSPLDVIKVRVVAVSGVEAWLVDACVLSH